VGTGRRTLTAVYAIIWEYRVKPEFVDEFVRVYGSNGDWARLFASADGFLGTELRRDDGEPLRFSTVDRWKDESHFRAFKIRFADEYAALDRRTSAWTTHERLCETISGT
jgi:heme-degrading monooxygenase HmoA